MPTRKKINYQPGEQDTFQTPPHALECLLPYISTHHDVYHDPTKHGGHDVFRSTVVWESAAGHEQLLVREIQGWGFSTIATDIQYDSRYDFFTYDPGGWDVLITNPPYSASVRYPWIRRCFELRKPWALLVPYETTFAKAFQVLFHAYHNSPWPVEVLSPERRIAFKTAQYGWGTLVYDEKQDKMVMRGDSATMPTCWITWGLNIENQIKSAGFKTFYVPMRAPKYDEDNNEIT